MINCNQADQLIQSSLDSALTPQQRQELDRHLIKCNNCKVSLTSYRALSRDIGSWVLDKSEHETDPSEFAANVMQKIQLEPINQSRPLLLWVPMSAIIALAVLFYFCLPILPSLRLPAVPDLALPSIVLPKSYQFALPQYLSQAWLFYLLIPMLIINVAFSINARRKA